MTLCRLFCSQACLKRFKHPFPAEERRHVNSLPQAILQLFNSYWYGHQKYNFHSHISCSYYFPWLCLVSCLNKISYCQETKLAPEHCNFLRRSPVVHILRNFTHQSQLLIPKQNSRSLIYTLVFVSHTRRSSCSLVISSTFPYSKMLSPLLFLAFTALAAARTDLSGCVSSETVAYGGASLIWYVPGTGEICAFLDCGGGTAPPKTTVPGCAAYSGTSTYSPSYLPGYQGGPAAVSSTTYEAATATSPSTAMITGSQTTAAVFEPSTTSETFDLSSSVLSSAVVTRSTSSNSTRSSSGSSTSFDTAASSSSTSNNAGVVSSPDRLYQGGIMGVVAAGFAFLL